MLLILFATSNSYGQSDVTWVGGAAGDWHGPGNWSPVTVPDNAGPVGPFYNVFVDSNAGTNTVVTVDPPPSIAYEIDSLTVDNGDTIHLFNEFTRLSIEKRCRSARQWALS